MGVPKFFRYTSERYPCLNELVKQYQIPDFDNMYLDMNGIIHNCSHPDDSNPHFRITEEKIYNDIFHYLNILFQIIRPKKLFFMAIDGVAPRAKMNQQRGRRFRSAREAEKLEENAKAKGEILPTEKRFDSNCITPGTVFMARLHEQLKYFVKQKMSTDPQWAKVKVILSGHETPGEGEHKIMDYIRWARSQPDYDPNTRHCLYGLDADLIMLGMCTHEPHFALLREEVKFGKSTQRATSPEETNFYLLHLSLLREYLEQEFIAIKDNLPFPYDIEKIVDDWVLMGFLVGNDFIPNLPNMHINNDALPLLYKTYMTVLPTLDGYINEAGDLNLARFEIFMQELAKIDKEKFQDTYADLKYFEGKTGRRPNALERKEYKPNNDETFNVNIEDIKANKPDDELQALINATQDMFVDDMELDEEYEDISDDEANFEMEFILHKKDYYMNKLDYSKVTEEVLAGQAEGYVRAIQWNLFYYYKGCPSWCWYYPHHYAPYISDIKGFKDLKIEFELGEPFKPFEQLLAVLPAASKHLLPAPFHELMTDEDSPIVHYYPIHFETDLNGKKNDWEAVVLIPFIDETNLLTAMSPCYLRLTDEELQRNKHGPMMVYDWTAQSQGPAFAPDYFPSISQCHAIESHVWRSELDVPPAQLKRGMLPAVDRDTVYPGFPTMRHLKYRTSLKKCKVKVFDQPSRNENMIVELIKDENEPLLEQVAQDYLGKVIWVGWPHLTKAKVISVSNEKVRYHLTSSLSSSGGASSAPSYLTESNAGSLHKYWLTQRSTVIEHNMNRLGIELGEVKIIVHAVNLKGYKYIIGENNQMSLEAQWCAVSCGHALQACVRAPRPAAPRACLLAPRDAYPPAGRVFLLTQGQYYGCMATVVDSESIRSGRIKVSVTEEREPVPVVHSMPTLYRSANHAAAAAGISAQMLSRVTGTVLVVSGVRNDLPTDTQDKVNLGLNLKFNKKNQEVSGYTRRCKVSNSWLYSERCISLVQEYAKAFPELFDKLACNMYNDIFFEGDLWPQKVGEKKQHDVVAWLKSQPHSSAVRRECGSDALEPEEMKALAASLDQQLQELKGTEKKVTLHVKWNLLYRSELYEGNISPDPKADFKIYDRIVCVASNITVPMGAKGTITAVYQPGAHNTVRLSDKLNAEPSYQVMFDETFPGAFVEDLFTVPRFYRMLPTNMLNMSYGRGLREAVTCARDVTSVAAPPPAPLPRDHHRSAFANYSPTSESKTPVYDNKNQMNVVNDQLTPKDNVKQDNGTQLLRSLLKISEADNDSSKKAKNTPDHSQNWRKKSDNVSTPPQRSQQQNWRIDKNPNMNKQQGYNEWTNRNYKGHMPVPPQPQFSYRGPVASQIPMPQFRQPAGHLGNQPSPGYHGNQQPLLSHHGNQPVVLQHGNQPTAPHHSIQAAALHHINQPTGVHGNQPTGLHGNQPAHGHYGSQRGQFPPHLPSLPGETTLGPSWIKNMNQTQTSTPHKQAQSAPQNVPQNTDRITNPFVPLQVQTSQRRSQQPSGAGQATANSASSATSGRTDPPHRPDKPKPQKPKRSRVAANLPFQLD